MAESANSGWKRCHIDGERISICIPAEWNIWDPPSELILLASSPDQVDPFEPQVTVSRSEVGQETTSTGYAVAHFAAISGLPGSEDLGTYEIEIGEGVNAIWIKYLFNVDGDPILCMSVVLVADGMGYIVNCKAPRDLYPGIQSVFDAIGASIRLTEE